MVRSRLKTITAHGSKRRLLGDDPLFHAFIDLETEKAVGRSQLPPH